MSGGTGKTFRIGVKAGLNSFGLPVDPQWDVDQLKVEIKGRKSRDFELLDADQLILVRVYTPGDKTSGVDNTIEFDELANTVQDKFYEGKNPQDVRVKNEPFPFPGMEWLSDDKTIAAKVMNPGYGLKRYSLERHSEEGTVDVVVIVPETGEIRKRRPESPLGDDLRYVAPSSLLGTLGEDWIYQPHDSLYQILDDNLTSHYANWKAGKEDKTVIPLYFAAAGAGSGKSRLLNEFKNIAIAAVSDLELKERFSKSLVFNISFENATLLNHRSETKPIRAIGLRMLYQLTGGNTGWGNFREKHEDFKDAEADAIMSKLIKNHNWDARDTTFIIALDGLQTAITNEEDYHVKHSFFYSCMTELSSLSRKKGGPFIIIVLSATVYVPFDQFLTESHQKRVFLPLAYLKPPLRQINEKTEPVFSNHPFIKILVEDMGGHGRALEVLEEATKRKDIDKEPLDTLLHSIVINLEDRYKEWVKKVSTVMVPALRIILANKLVKRNEKMLNSEYTVDEAMKFGLVRFEEVNVDKGYMKCAYVFLWLYAKNNDSDPLLKLWNFEYLLVSQNRSNPIMFPPGLCYWQNFEEFIARFRVMKSMLYKVNEIISLKELHSGARMQGDVRFKNRHLKLEKSVKQVPTNSSAEFNPIQCEFQKIEKSGLDKFYIINGTGAPAGDGFCGVTKEDDSLIHEVHQMKLYLKTAMTEENYAEEHAKAAGENDFFMLFTNAKYPEDYNIKMNSGVVDLKAWNDYFGPFAGRAFRYLSIPPSANSSCYSVLTSVSQIGGERASLILSERKKKPFEDIEDCSARTKISKNILRNLSFAELTKLETSE